jgi:uncharacterized protein (DUF2345 family)
MLTSFSRKFLRGVLDASARLDVKITSSEGKVEINSPNEIVLRAKEDVDQL